MFSALEKEKRCGQKKICPVSKFHRLVPSWLCRGGDVSVVIKKGVDFPRFCGLALDLDWRVPVQNSFSNSVCICFSGQARTIWAWKGGTSIRTCVWEIERP